MVTFHCTTAGKGGTAECPFFDDKINSRLVDMFRLLFSDHPSAVNARDEHVLTPLYHTIKTHAYWVGRRHAELAVRVMLEHGADAAVPNSCGRTTLQLLSDIIWPVDTILLDLLITHGADVNHADDDGNRLFTT